MARKPKQIAAANEVIAKLNDIVTSDRSEQRLVMRSQIILNTLNGLSIEETASKLQVSTVTVIKWRNRFLKDGIAGLMDLPRSGRNAVYTASDEQKILDTIAKTPPDGLSCWDGKSLAQKLGFSDDFIWRTVRKHNINLDRTRSWYISTDLEFSAKAVDIAGLYLSSPENAIVLSIDEEPSLQALSRASGFVKTQSGDIAKAYKRKGSLNLFVALEIASSKIHGRSTKYKKRANFLEFMDELLREYPTGEKISFHVILDSDRIHKHGNKWLEAHPNVVFHYTQTAADWLNTVEIWFGIIGGEVFKDPSVNSAANLKNAIANYLQACDKYNAQPFQWRKKEVNVRSQPNS